MPAVRAVVALGDELLDAVADQLFASVAEQLLGLRVDQHDRAVLTHDHHRIGGGLEQATELLLRVLPIRDVADRAGYQRALVRLER